MTAPEILSAILHFIDKGEHVLDVAQSIQPKIQALAEDLKRVVADFGGIDLAHPNVFKMIPAILTALPDLQKFWADIEELEKAVAAGV